ncbi:MAG: helix-turn-helix domain-containing protein [Saprospiraceae bacterium]|nr:helix-turn-helix domain-containing protein [Saprospiraceae bacterium]
MQYQFTDSNNAVLRLSLNEKALAQKPLPTQTPSLLTIAWNRGEDQCVEIDEVKVKIPSKTFLTLMSNQTFKFERTEEIALWQFNSDFYCIIEHDQEVSCVGFLFYGNQGSMLIRLTDSEYETFSYLLRVFEEEFKEKDAIQGEMLRVMLKRLIIKLTRLAKKQHAQNTSQPALDIIRQYNLLVENNYKKLHQVRDYADMLHKSPKTLANLFALNGQPSPLQIILDRLALEARRLLIYTPKTLSEITFELGFEELAHFSRFFKNAVGQSPSEFRLAQKK